MRISRKDKAPIGRSDGLAPASGMIAHSASLEGHVPAAIIEETGPLPGANRIPNMLLFYATRDGQSRRIAAHIAARLDECGIYAPPQNLADALPAPAALAAAPLIVVVAAVRYGRHLPEAERFFATYGELLARVPFAFVSVNLAARKPGKDTAAGNQYLRKLMARHRLKPALAAAVAGRLDYPHYRWLDRQIIRFIMKMTGGPTDPQSCVEFTAWQAVDEIAARIAEIMAMGLSGCGRSLKRTML